MSIKDIIINNDVTFQGIRMLEKSVNTAKLNADGSQLLHGYTDPLEAGKPGVLE